MLSETTNKCKTGTQLSPSPQAGSWVPSQESSKCRGSFSKFHNIVFHRLWHFSFVGPGRPSDHGVPLLVSRLLLDLICGGWLHRLPPVPHRAVVPGALVLGVLLGSDWACGRPAGYSVGLMGGMPTPNWCGHNLCICDRMRGMSTPH